MIRFGLLLFIFIGSLSQLSAQDSLDLPLKWIHVGTGINAYSGDLDGRNKYTSTFQIGLQLNRKKRVNGALNIGIGSINAEDRNFTFSTDQANTPSVKRFVKTNIFYINYDLHVNIIKRNNFIAYISQGIGLIRFSPKDESGNELIDMPETRLEGESYRQESLMLPTSLGAIYILPNDYGLSFQASYLNTLTDYLDNISELGDSSNNDNILSFRIAFFIPLP